MESFGENVIGQEKTAFEIPPRFKREAEEIKEREIENFRETLPDEFKGMFGNMLEDKKKIIVYVDKLKETELEELLKTSVTSKKDLETHGEILDALRFLARFTKSEKYGFLRTEEENKEQVQI